MRRKNVLVYRNGRYYENGKLLRKRDYAECHSSHEQDYILSFLTGQKHLKREVRYDY